MEFNEYQPLAHATSDYPKEGTTATLLSHALAHASEAGEIAGVFDKWFRDGGTLDRDALIKELGDSLWTLAEVCTANRITLEEVAHQNLSKLADRKQRNVIHGSGSNR